MRQKYKPSKSYRQRLVLLILLLPLLQSCDKTLLSGEGSFNFNIGDAKTLFISSQPLQTRAVSQGKALTENKIFKVTESGATLEVNFTDELGIIVSGDTMNPVAILPAGHEYLLFCFGTGSTLRYDLNDAYLVRRDTGAAYQVQSEYFPLFFEPASQYHLAVPQIQSDNDGNLYWVIRVFDNSVGEGFYHAIAKISGLSGADVKIRRITSSNDFIFAFLVDSNGNIVYEYAAIPHPKSRLFTKTNSLYNLGEWLAPYIGLSGNIRFLNGSELNTIVINLDNTVSFQKQSIPAVNFGVDEYYYKIGDEIYKFSRYLPAQYCAESGSTFFETIEFEGLTQISSIKASDSKAYFSGTDNYTSKLIAYTPHDKYETLLPGLDGIEYDVSTFEVSSDDEISFIALRLKDNKRVLGTIDALKQITIIGEEGDATVTSLLQVN